MLESYQKLITGNKNWVTKRLSQDPDFFNKLAEGQEPKFLWIGCSDSRVSANEITDTEPGEIFVHRNIANMVVHTDINLLSVLQYAVEVLKVKHVIVCGHYGCGGIKAAMSNNEFGLIDNWLRNIKDVYRFHNTELDSISDDEKRAGRLTELNVIEQVYNLTKTSIIQTAWKNENRPHIHGWIYDLHEGIIKDLNVAVKDNSEMENIYKFNTV